MIWLLLLGFAIADLLLPLGFAMSTYYIALLTFIPNKVTREQFDLIALFSFVAMLFIGLFHYFLNPVIAGVTLMGIHNRLIGATVFPYVYLAMKRRNGFSSQPGKA